MKQITRIIGIHYSPENKNCSTIKIDVEHGTVYVSAGKYWCGEGCHIFMSLALSKSKTAFQIDHYIVDRNELWEELKLALHNHGLNTNSILVSNDRKAFDGLTDFAISLNSNGRLKYPNDTTEIQELRRQISNFSTFREVDGKIVYYFDDDKLGDIVWAYLAALYGAQKVFTNNDSDLI